MTRPLAKAWLSSFGRTLLLVYVAIGLVLPSGGALLAAVAGLETIVICRGDSLVSITINEHGEPVETELKEHGPCLLADLPPPAGTAQPAWLALEHLPYAPNPGGDSLPRASFWHGPPPERGPPPAV